MLTWHGISRDILAAVYTVKQPSSNTVHTAMVCPNHISIWLAIIISILTDVLASDQHPALRKKPKSKSLDAPHKKRRPNIVFILVDDLGFNDVGYHGVGGAALKTPNIDRLAKEGVRLENYYVQPSCTPTRSQLMTGRYQIHTGMQHDNLLPTSPHCLPVHELTLAEALRKAGYSTHAVGKWHLGFCRRICLPTRRGFDSFLGMVLGHSNHFNYIRRAGSALYHNEMPLKLTTEKYSTTLYTERAMEVISYHAGASKPPLFLFVSYQSQHTPLQVPSHYADQFRTTISDTRRQIYAAMLSAVDEGVQNITQSLIDNGLWENTLLIFSTDNGGRPRSGGNNWPLRGSKGTLWEGGVRGVAFVTGPVLPKAVRGTVNNELCHVSDWFPTLVKGVARKQLDYIMPLDGINVWRSISQGKRSPRKELLHNIDPLQRPTEWTEMDEELWGRLKDLPFNATLRAAIRSDNWKLVTGNAGGSEWVPPPESTDDVWNIVKGQDVNTCIRLFDLKIDPVERFNVAATYPGIVRTLLGRLAELQASAVPAIDHTITIEFRSMLNHTYRSPMPHPMVKVYGVWAQWMD